MASFGCSDDIGGRRGTGSRTPTCTSNANCNDRIDCTVDVCAQNGRCTHTPDDSVCEDGEICRVQFGCTPPPSCSFEDDPNCDDGQACTTDSCDVAAGQCVYERDDASCDDGTFCNGTETCAPFMGCIAAARGACDDNVACTSDACDEASQTCSSTINHSLCDDGMFCNGAERCDVAAGGCMPGTPPVCDDGDFCTADRCDDAAGGCVAPIRDVDRDGEADQTCGGTDCNDGNPAVNTRATEICDGIDNDCRNGIDDGVASPCGDCDPTCRQDTRTATTPTSQNTAFDTNGMTGTYFDSVQNGLTVSVVSLTSNDMWVPNTAESTLSKWDASSAMETGRFRVGLASGVCPNVCCWNSGCNMPSRVVVDGDGNAYVANRGFQMQGTVTKVAADRRYCVDRNNNGTIETSSTSVPLPLGTDECVLWNVAVGPSNAVLRSIAIDRGDEDRPEGYPWVGGYSNQTFWKLDPDNGSVLDTVRVNFRPYGAVVVSDGKMWVSNLDGSGLGWVDTSTTPVTYGLIPAPANMRNGCRSMYGLTADSQGRIWMAGWSCRDALGYDPAMNAWTRADLTSRGQTTGRGITVDQNGKVWVAIGGDGQSSLASWDMNAFQPNGNITAPITYLTLPPNHRGPSGVGADASGRIWVGHYLTSQLVRVDPATGHMTSFTGPNQIYTYSDFTGAVRRSVIGRGFYQETHRAGCPNPIWERLTWDATVPFGASLSMTVRTSSAATTEAALGDLDPIPVAVLPGPLISVDLMSVLANAGIVGGPLMKLSFEFESSNNGDRPVLRRYDLRWHCN